MEQYDNNEKWVSEVWRKYSYFVLKNDTKLMLVDTSMHTIDIVKDKIKKWKEQISLIPGGLTRYLKPLDASINKPFKDELKKRYTKYCIDQKDTIKDNQKDLINWVGEIWYDDKLSS